MPRAEKLKARPGIESAMRQKPKFRGSHREGSNKLKGKVALITGGDSGIGRAVAVAFAREGAQVAIGYLNEGQDARDTKSYIEEEGVDCLTLAGDIGDTKTCRKMVKKVINRFGRLDILVNNAGEQHPQVDIRDISEKQLEQTFRTNIFSMFFLTQAALEHLKKGVIINTASVTAFKGNPALLDYSATKGAIIAFTRSLALQLAPKNIRVNAVAPGPIWTPLIPSTFPKKHVTNFGKDTAMGRPGEPEEVAQAFVYLASSDSSYVTGQTIHVNGGQIINS